MFLTTHNIFYFLEPTKKYASKKPSTKIEIKHGAEKQA